MSHIDAGPLAAYNSLQDKHLVGYFNNSRMRRHLRRSGLVTRNGEIVTESSFRLTMARKEHQKHVRDLMAQAIVHKALDMERHRQVQIKQKLEEISKVELVQRVRTTRGRKGDEDITPYLSPRAPKGRPKSAKQERPRSVVSHHRPATAPSKQSKATKKKSAVYVDEDGFPVHRDQAWAATDSGEEVDSHNLRELDPYIMNNITLNMSPEEKLSNSPYKVDLTLPEPKPPAHAPPGSKRSPRMSSSRSVVTKDGRRLRPKSNKGSLSLHRKEPAYPHAAQQQTLCDVTIRYRGNNLKLQYERQDRRDEIVINQQHCGGENLVVFHGLVEPGTDLVFTSRRHRGFPFSLTFFLNQIQVLRLSACCEYKYGPGVMLGGRKGHFKFGRVDRGAPCYRCMVEAELARRERQRYKDTQTEESKPEPEPEPVLESQGTQSEPPPPETRDQNEQAQADDVEAEGGYDDEDFEEEDDKKDAASEKEDAPKTEDKNSDHFFSGPESDAEQKQPDDTDYDADSDFEVESNHGKKQDEDEAEQVEEMKEEDKDEEEEIQEGDAKDTAKEAPKEAPKEEPLQRDDGDKNEADQIPEEEDEAQEVSEQKDNAEEVPEEKDEGPSVPENSYQAEDKKQDEDEHQTSKHDDSDSDSDSDSDGEEHNRVLSSSSSSSSEDEGDHKVLETNPTSSSDSDSEDEEYQEKWRKEQEKQVQNETKEETPYVAENKDETKTEDNIPDDDEKKEEIQSPSPPATEERDIPETVDTEQQEDEQQEEEIPSNTEDGKQEIEVEIERPSSSLDGNQEQIADELGYEQETDCDIKDNGKDDGKDVEDTKKEENSVSDNLSSGSTSSDSDLDDEKEKKQKSNKSDSENDDVHEGTSSKEQNTQEEADSKDDGEHLQDDGSTQGDSKEDGNSSTEDGQEDKEDESKEPGTPPNEENKEMYHGASDSEDDTEKKEDAINVEEPETGAIAQTQVEGPKPVQNSQGDDSRSQSEKDVSDEEKDEKDETASHGKDSVLVDKDDSDAQSRDDASLTEEDDRKVDAADEEKNEEVKDDEEEHKDEAKDVAEEKTYDDEDANNHKTDEDKEDVVKEKNDEDKDDEKQKKYGDEQEEGDGTQNTDEDEDAVEENTEDDEIQKATGDEVMTDVKEDESKEDTEAEKEDEDKEQGVSDVETGINQEEEVEPKQEEARDEEDKNAENQGDGDAAREGSLTSRSSVSDSGSIATGLDKDYRVLNLNTKNLDEKKAIKLAKVLKQPKYRNLEYLLLRDNSLTDAGVATIIRSLIERHNEGNSADSSLKLSHLDLGNSGMGDESATELSHLLTLDTQLRNLNISENILSAAAWEAIIDKIKANKLLVTFSAEYAHLSDTSCVMLTEALADHEKLEELNIEGNGLGERAGKAVAQLVKDNSIITTVNLEQDNSISPKILKEVKEILETGSYVP